MSISKYSQQKDVAMEYLRWFQTQEVQREWAKRGGYPARKSVQATGLFLNAATYHPIFSVSFPLAKDFWNVPEYGSLLDHHMTGLQRYLLGELSEKQALNYMANNEQKIFDEVYPNGPPRSGKRELKVSDGARYAFIVLAAILSVVAIVMMILIFKYKNQKVMHYASWPFLIVTLIGVVMMLSSIYSTSIYPQTIESCNFSVWLVSTGFVVAFAPLWAKTFRVWRIISKAKAIQKVKPITNLHLGVSVMLCVFIVWVILICWVAIDPLVPLFVTTNEATKAFALQCASTDSNPFVASLFSIFGIFVVFGAFLAAQTRGAFSHFNESSHIAIILYNLVLVFAIFIPIIFTVAKDSPTTVFVMSSVGVILASSVTMFVLLGPKFLRIWNGKGNDSLREGVRGRSQKPSAGGRGSKSSVQDTRSSGISMVPESQDPE